MAIHPDIESLLAALEDSPLSWLADIARARIQSSELSEDAADAFSQLATVDKVVRVVLERELTLTQELQEIAPKLDISSVAVLVSRGDGETQSDQLLSSERRGAITNFLNAWEQARTSIAASLESNLRG